MKAIWNNEVIADSNETIVVEGNDYFPLSSVSEDFLKPSNTVYECPWKGTASYYTLCVAGAEYPDAAWSYAKPKDAAKEIAGHIAFDSGVQIIE